MPNRDTDKNDTPCKNPSEAHLQYNDITLPSKDPKIKLHGWLVKAPNPSSTYTIVFFHENSGNIGHRMSVYFNIHNMLGANIFAFDYRGYGKSTGEPKEEGFEQDCQAIMEYIIADKIIDPKRIFIHGKSLGGSLAIYSALKYSSYVC